jgi:Protein of unknown function (DUF1552)
VSHFKLHRRKFISSSGLMLTLPMLDFFAPLYRANAVFLYMPNGTYNKSADSPWHPASGKLTANLPDVLSPFAANISDFSVLKAIGSTARVQTDNNYYKFNGNGGGHVSAVSSYLSGQVISTPGSMSCSISRPSIDQQIGALSGKPGLVLHVGGLTAGADGSPFDYSNYISFAGGKPVQPMSNPLDVFRKLFSMVTSTVPTPAPVPKVSAATQKSILDSAVGDINDLKNKLGKNDRSKLDDYLTTLRSIETTLITTPPPVGGGTCSPAASPTKALDNYGGEGVRDYIPRVQAYFDMIAFAFQCDMIRSVTFMFDGEVGERILSSQVPANLVFQGAALASGMHSGIAHNGGRNMNVTKDRVYMSLLMYLVSKLKATTDVSGSPVLDNTAIHMGYGVPAGDHVSGAAPTILAGGRNFLSPGNSYDMSAADQRDLLYTIGSKMNVGITSFEGSSKLLTL